MTALGVGCGHKEGTTVFLAFARVAHVTAAAEVEVDEYFVEAVSAMVSIPLPELR